MKAPAEPKVMCEMDVIDRAISGFFRTEMKPCPNRAKVLVVCPGWTKKMCLTHGKPYQREMRARVSYVRSVTPL